jgi:hypothetical protein
MLHTPKHYCSLQKHTYIIGYTFYSKLLCTMDDDGPSNNERGRFCRTRITHLTSYNMHDNDATKFYAFKKKEFQHTFE